PHADAALPQVPLHAEVTHVRGHDLALAALHGADRHDVVARDQAALPVDEEGPVGVAVERDPDVEPALDDAPRHRVGAGGAAVDVDVLAVGIGVHDLEAGADLREHLRGQQVAGAVRAVDHHLHADRKSTRLNSSHVKISYA